MNLILLSTIVLAGTQLVKMTLGVTKRFIPLVAFSVSLVVFVAYSFFNKLPFSWEILSVALITGFTAGGIYSNGRAILTK